MILLDHPSPIIHEATSLFSNWEFWIAAFTVIGGMVASWYRQVGMINILKIELKNQDDKHTARIDTLKETVNSDRLNLGEDYTRLYELCTEMNQRLATMEGVWKNANN